MHTDTLLPPRQSAPVPQCQPPCSALSLGVDMDGLGLIWTLPATVPPWQRLAFALAVHEAGGLFFLTDADRGFLNVERVVRCTAALTLARTQGAVHAGYAFAQLFEALGYDEHDTRGFELIAPADRGHPAAFIAGFGAAVAQSLETDVMRIVCGEAGAPLPLTGSLRRLIGGHGTGDVPWHP